MENIEKIYKVIGGAVRSVEVEKTTSKMVFIPRCREFNYSRALERDSVSVTPTEAVQEAKNRALTQIGIWSDRLIAAESELEAILQLEREL